MLAAQRLGKLGKSLDKGKARDVVIQDYDFAVTPTCPPSTAVNIRAGKAWRDSTYWAYMAYNVEKASDVLDFVTSDNIGARSATGMGARLRLSFSTPYAYIPLALALSTNWIQLADVQPDTYFHGKSDYKYYDVGPRLEFLTAQEAEAHIDKLLNGGYPTTVLYQIFNPPYLALCSFILRNDGMVNVPLRIQPIDRINRGRSYIYRDLRPSMSRII